MSEMTIDAIRERWGGHEAKLPIVCELLTDVAFLLAHIEALEKAERNHVERKHIDATPNDGYPLRVLRAYRADCDMRWADTSDGEVGNPLTIALNEMQDQRAAILDRAIAALAAEEERP